ncbi:hypothetical protein [Streptomyces sp. FL07-04A]|uniref:hypothetical protein n=1 Tax=Streptomyces sp. FL07-04A TaxID=3028658 RepID=UPI0029A35F05|nr:hypothetical protein [Streptomyces sp. FL07-04A]MDX3575939.1 hypothetical protein [Streptomyces sp. FL07-04A]
MTAIPPAAIAVIAAALDDYRLTTPTHAQTPRGAAERAAEYLLTSGWGLYIPPNHQPPTRTRARCPHCTVQYLITQQGRLYRHGPHGHPCPGSGTPASTPA